MKNKRIVILIGLALCGGVALLAWKNVFNKKDDEVVSYATIMPEARSIKSIVKSSGTIEVKNMVKIGSLILGRVDKLLVEENDRVKKGQLLAIIDDGKDDNDVKEAAARLEQNKAEAAYTQKHFERNTPMHEQGFISDDAYDQIRKNRDYAQSGVDLSQALYDKTKLLYEHKFIKSPVDGVIISKNISEGETATLTSPATIIYTIAPDLSTMEVKLEVDEGFIANLKTGASAQLIFTTYPDARFEAIIRDVSRAPHTVNAAVHYIVTLDLKNPNDRFKPGMSVDAEIVVFSKDNVKAIPSHVFMISPEGVKAVAQQKGIKLHELNEDEREKLNRQENTKIVWIERKGEFYEQPIIIGLNDRAYYEIVSGLELDDRIISDVPEHDATGEFFKKMFGKGMK